jgi:putative GTP pyrophosphokinase
MTDDELEREYTARYEELLKPLAARIQDFLADVVRDVPRVDRVSARAKSPPRFLAKASKEVEGSRKYLQPFRQIQDQIGARVLVFYLRDVDAVSKVVNQYFKGIEERALIPDSESEFGYIGQHFILAVPEDVYPADDALLTRIPKFFELQVKTLFQHAWSEASHDIAYKPVTELTSLHKRQLAFTAAQAWGADQMFETLAGDLLAEPHG